VKKFFCPESVAIIGAPGKTGVGSFNNVEMMIRYGYGGRIYPVNPRVQEICGLKCYPSVLEVPEAADLAVISVGRDRVIPLFLECAQAGIRRVVVVTQGLGDADERGKILQRELVSLARRHEIRIVGPNTMGIVNNYNRFTTGFVDLPYHEDFSPISLIAQTGFIQVASKDYAYRWWGKALDIGNAADVHFADGLRYFGDDPETEVIALHMEGIERGREFLEIASEVTRKKPIVVLKTGRSRAGAKAALSHTGSLTGEDAVFEAAFERAGILRVRDTAELRDTLRALVCMREMKGPGVGVITVTGAGGIMAIDACEERGIGMAPLPAGLSDRLKAGMPEWLHVGNPVDIWPIGMIGGDYPGSVRTTLDGMLASPDVHGVLLITPALKSPLHADMSDLTGGVAEAREKSGNDKPIAIFPYADESGWAPDHYERIRGVAAYPSAEECARGLAACYRYHRIRNRRVPSPERLEADAGRAEPLVAKGRKEGLLLGEDALALLGAFGIPVAQGRILENSGEWDGLSGSVPYPVVLKVHGRHFLHKSEWGGVVTGIADRESFSRAWAALEARVREKAPGVPFEGFQVQEAVAGTEILFGIRRDPQFGPVVACGFGGIYTEVFRDVARRIAPIDREEAREMIRSLRMYPILQGIRGRKGTDLERLADVLLRISSLALEIPDLLEMDVNPFICGETGFAAVDARMLWGEVS
jgi:acetyltransferase